MTRAVVVGSGPNGLAAALVLADAGMSVEVVEATDTLGGGTRSAELTLPGLVHDVCAAIHPLAIATRFSQAFDLAEHGLSWVEPEVQYSHPLDAGRGAAAYRSVEETARQLGGRDGRTWARVFGSLTDRFDTIADEFLQPVLHVPRHPAHLGRFSLYAGQPASLLARRWRDDEARALLAGLAAHAFRPLGSLASSAIGVALGTAAHRYGWGAAVGGSAAISTAMVAAAKQRGVLFETGRTVTGLDELGPADVVMLDTAPGAAADIVGDRLPRHVARAYRRYRHGPGAFKVDFAVEGGVPWSHEPSRRAGTVHVGGTFEEVAAAEASVARGQMPERPFVLAAQQYVADPTRSVGDVHPFYTYAHVPAGYTGDATEAIVAQVERFAPGFRDRIRATAVCSTTEMSRKNANYVGGDIVSGANDPLQLVFRPRVTLHPYATGVDGVLLCSAATPPGAGAHGMSGYWAARAALRSVARG
ncbi:NAD(P)/FAD-dependent oxidoreductase [Aeromicrobium sp. CnD17-E]|uniref:phytoene desaturase family protein n=1 Tax=Aeromicrobium sp. CnD17-E TaxID=2954487 RepID=UPI002097D2A2|nr:NAD(P)/FAD-dependent oxidoreductase [Aeromicrobium sp. CnD17-E]MCO7239552.1 NAD(P)/FAD-dependent oxidoreductase [Aeromicrobium sp. CnD17-E]